MDKSAQQKEWLKSAPDIFWGEIAPSNLLVQLYDKDQDFLDLLERFAVRGFKAGESVIIIASELPIRLDLMTQ